MSSCFLCDCSYKFKTTGATETDTYSIVYKSDSSLKKCMKYMPIMVGSSGIETDRLGHVVDLGTDQQHKDNNKQNYVSYRVKKVEFCFSYFDYPASLISNNGQLPDYVLIFKVPFREPVFDYYFTVFSNFMLFSEPECVLDYKVLQPKTFGGIHDEFFFKHHRNFNININKPFIVGPNDYVGVLYMFTPNPNYDIYVNASARVWFDIA